MTTIDRGAFQKAQNLELLWERARFFLNFIRHEENEKYNKFVSMKSYSDLIGGKMINQLLPEVITWDGGHIQISE